MDIDMSRPARAGAGEGDLLRPRSSRPSSTPCCRLPAHRGRPAAAPGSSSTARPGHVTVWARETDEDGAVLREYDDTPDGFGRIAATHREAGHPAAAARGRGRADLRGVRRPRGRHRRRASIQQGPDPRDVLVDLGKIEADPARAGAGAGRAATSTATRLKLLRRRRPQGAARAADHAVAHPPRTWSASCSPSRCPRSPTARSRSPRSPARPATARKIAVRSTRPGRQRQGRLHRADGLPGAQPS